MNPRYREIHRDQIKRRMYKVVEYRWETLYATFVASIVLAVMGVKFCFISRSGSCGIGAFLFFLGALFFFMYRWALRIFRRQWKMRVWFTTLDQLIMAGFIGLGIVLSDYVELIWLAGFLIALSYANWKFWKYMRPLWRIYYFRTAREYFRDIESYSPST